MTKLARLVGLALTMQAVNPAQPGNGGAARSDRNKVAKKEYDLDTRVVSITFSDESALELDCNELPSEIQTRLMLHGASQKLGDSFAGVKGNVAEAKTNVQAVIDALRSGEWGTGGDEARPRLAELAEAISRIKNTDLEKTKAAVEKASDEQRKAWRSNAKVKATIAQLRAEKAQKALEAAGEQTLDIAVEQ